MNILNSKEIRFCDVLGNFLNNSEKFLQKINNFDFAKCEQNDKSQNIVIYDKLQENLKVLSTITALSIYDNRFKTFHKEAINIFDVKINEIVVETKNMVTSADQLLDPKNCFNFNKKLDNLILVVEKFQLEKYKPAAAEIENTLKNTFEKKKQQAMNSEISK